MTTILLKAARVSLLMNRPTEAHNLLRKALRECNRTNDKRKGKVLAAMSHVRRV